MRNRRVSGPLPSYFNETFHSRDIDTRTTLDEGRENFREGNERFIKTRLYDNSRFFLRFGQSFFFAISILRKDVARIIYITSFPVYLL